MWWTYRFVSSEGRQEKASATLAARRWIWRSASWERWPIFAPWKPSLWAANSWSLGLRRFVRCQCWQNKGCCSMLSSCFLVILVSSSTYSYLFILIHGVFFPNLEVQVMLVVGRHRLGGFAWSIPCFSLWFFDSTSPVISGSQVDYGPGYWSDFGGCQWGSKDLKICAYLRDGYADCCFQLVPAGQTRKEIGWRGEQKTMVWGGNSEILLEIPDGSQAVLHGQMLGTGWVRFVGAIVNSVMNLDYP